MATAKEAEKAAQKPATAGRQIGEWFWRFLSFMMLFAVAWAIWIFYQLSPRPLATRAAFEAAASAKASQDAKGVIAPAGQTAPAPAAAPGASAAVTPAAAGAEAQPPKPEAAASAPAVPVAPKEPPVNIEKLKLTDSIEKPIPERAAKK